MYRHWLVRIGLVLGLVPGLLAAGTANSSAAPEGTELVESLAAEASGDDAFAMVAAVDAFQPAGGEAVFEPGTDYEETFTYEAADPETNRLIGLTRPSPLSHPAGALVAPVATVDEAAEPEPAPSADAEAADPGASVPDAEPTAEPAIAGPPIETSDPTEDASVDAAVQDVIAPGQTSSSTPSPCEILLDRSCEEVVAEICSEGIVCEILQDPLSLCAEGVVCEIVHDPLSLCAEGVVCEIVHDPLSVCASPPDPFVANLCEAPGDPIGWSACDVDNTDASCPDPEDVIDIVYGIDNPLSDLECTASTEGPWISQQGGMVRGRGVFDCHEAVEWIEIRVCLHWRSGGAWLKLGCRYEADPGLFGTPTSITKKIAEACVRQQTVKYRIRAHGEAEDGGETDQDTASGIDELYCPGTEPSGLTTEAGEYGDTWTPGSG